MPIVKTDKYYNEDPSVGDIIFFYTSYSCEYGDRGEVCEITAIEKDKVSLRSIYDNETHYKRIREIEKVTNSSELFDDINKKQREMYKKRMEKCLDLFLILLLFAISLLIAK